MRLRFRCVCTVLHQTFSHCLRSALWLGCFGGLKKTGRDRALGKVGKGQCLLPAGPRVENERLREVEIQKYLESCQYAFEKVKHDSCTNTPVSKT